MIRELGGKGGQLGEMEGGSVACTSQTLLPQGARGGGFSVRLEPPVLPSGLGPFGPAQSKGVMEASEAIPYSLCVCELPF